MINIYICIRDKKKRAESKINISQKHFELKRYKKKARLMSELCDVHGKNYEGNNFGGWKG